jgi:capsular exopolysaccharide synthesis family protein
MSPGEGKTATAVNLALTIAQQSERAVLLIDSDLRKPRIHKIFSLNNDKGLSSYLSGNSELNIVSQGLPANLSIIPSGPIPPNPSELLGSSMMFQLVKDLSEKYDIIIFDSPPLAVVSDSYVLSKVTDGTILVAKANETTFDSVRRGIKNLGDMQAHLLGLIINCLDPKRSGYYYSGYYSYHSYTTKDN